MRYIAPAGTPVTIGDIAHGVTGSQADPTAAVSAALRLASGLPNAWPISSGRAAMTIILDAMRSATDDRTRDEVIIPAYTCYSVPATIERAGLKPRLCDVDPETLGMNLEALDRCDFARTLAVISANLFGLPNDLVAIEAVCRRRGVFLLDDAAQALGASVDGRAVGSFGDAGVYSFDKGKIISTMQGGAIVCRQSPLAAGLEALVTRIPRGTFPDTIGNLFRLVVYSIFLRPALYGLIRRLPFTGLGHTRYETRYPVTKLSKFQTGVAATLLTRLADLNAGRRQHAKQYTNAFQGLAGVDIVRVIPGAQAVFARFPIRVRNASIRNHVLATLDRAGIGATASYPLCLADVPEVVARIPAEDRDCPGAREVARTIVTLPTHAYCPPTLAETVCEILHVCVT